MSDAQSQSETPVRSLLARLERCARATGKGAIRGLYKYWAATYDGMLVRRLGYYAPELVAAALAERMPDTRQSVLDVGCGTGLTAQALAALREDVIDGIDFSPEMLERARGKGIYRDLVRADVTRPLPLPEASYDAAISSGLFTHGHVGSEAIPHILAAIRPGGLFGFTVYWKVWERAGFAQLLDELTASGRIEVLHHSQQAHFRLLKGQQVHTLVVRVN